MSISEQNALIRAKDASGNSLIIYPITKADNVDGLDEVISTKMDSENPVGTGSFSMNRKEDSSIGPYSHAEGYYATASGMISHAEGCATTASGAGAHAEGMGTIASQDYQHVQGEYNIEDTSKASKYYHIVGNGSSDTKRSNAHTLDYLGNAWFAGDVYVGSTSGTNKDAGSEKLITANEVQTQITTALSEAKTYTDEQLAGLSQIQFITWGADD